MIARRLNLEKYRELLEERSALVVQGRVSQVVGLLIEVEGLKLGIGDICQIVPERGRSWISAEVVGFRDDRLIVTPFADVEGVRPGSIVLPRSRGFTVPVGEALWGRVLDGLGRPIDGLGPLGPTDHYPVASRPPDPLSRAPIRTPLCTGVRAIDGMLTCGMGQRVGIFAGSGVGKSTLMGMIARNAESDVNVIALVGERGREVQEFIEHDLGPQGLARSVVIVATSDQPALQRIKAAWVATAVAEFFRDQGKHVTLMMDSVTRWAMALREVGLTVGEPPVVKGYPPSVFAFLPKLLERAGTSDRGTITGFYTVLVEGDDLTEPIADAARSILDGHIWLTRKLAHEAHYPSIDLLVSVSRLMTHLATPEHLHVAHQLREALASYRTSEDLINIGAYVAGANPALDRALGAMPQINAFLKQPAEESTPFEETIGRLLSIFPEEVISGAL
ncbi:MAG: flagellum-specific synthase [Chloroflexota bacterium]|jgi:FliI/YscN family ATPase|nr:flagellum-specific synthase [Chloroflexota bacterium]